MTKRAGSDSIFWIVIVVIAIAAMSAFVWQDFLNKPVVTVVDGYKFRVQPGASYKMVTAELNQQQIIKHPFLFNLLFRIRGDFHQLKAGEYLFPNGATPGKIINQMVTGTGFVYHPFTIVPGMNFRQLREALNKEPDFTHTTQSMTDKQIMQQLGLKNMSPEGWFFPDTYFFLTDSPDLNILKRAFAAMQQKVLKYWQARASSLPFRTPYEALIAASIIEKEAHDSRELPIIAGVMVNRLRKGIMLQFDPTVIYGEGEHYNGTIYRRDLRAVNNPYNTYTHKGLPPTPISMPGRLAIEAVMHPSQNDYLYFVAKGDGATHQFSTTLAEHNIAVKRYQPENINHPLVKQAIKQYIVKPAPPLTITN